MKKIFSIALLFAVTIQTDDFCDAKRGLKENETGLCDCINSSYWMNDDETACLPSSDRSYAPSSDHSYAPMYSKEPEKIHDVKELKIINSIKLKA